MYDGCSEHTGPDNSQKAPTCPNFGKPVCLSYLDNEVQKKVDVDLHGVLDGLIHALVLRRQAQQRC